MDCLCFIFALIAVIVFSGPVSKRILSQHSIEGVVSELKTGDNTVVFEDGRSISFTNIPYKPINLKKYYTLTYNTTSFGTNELVSVDEKK